MSEKTEKPTSKKLRDAREEGQIVKSQEINGLVQLAVILLWLTSEGPALQQAIAGSIHLSISVINQPLQQGLAQYIGHLQELWQRFLVGLAAIVAVSLTLIGLIQSGFLFAPKGLKPSMQRLNPLSNFKQMFSLKSVFDLIKMLVKVGILGLTFYYLVKQYAASFASLGQTGLSAGMAVCAQMVQWMWATLLAVTAVFAIADYGMQYYQLRKQLMMSLEDIKQEFKNSEGSPETKHRRREMHREVQSGSLAGKVAKSSVVVRNPTHIAVCLRYVPGETPLPQVIEYSRDQGAKRIVRLAEKFGIPVVENVPLARALIAQTSPGDYIPESLFQAVATLLSVLRDQIMEEQDADE